jgi:hypothetical protein
LGEEYERRGQIEIFSHEEWYLRSGALSREAVLQGWLDREADQHGIRLIAITGYGHDVESQRLPTEHLLEHRRVEREQQLFELLGPHGVAE